MVAVGAVVVGLVVVGLVVDGLGVEGLLVEGRGVVVDGVPGRTLVEEGVAVLVVGWTEAVGRGEVGAVLATVALGVGPADGEFTACGVAHDVAVASAIAAIARTCQRMFITEIRASVPPGCRGAGQ